MFHKMMLRKWESNNLDNFNLVEINYPQKNVFLKIRIVWFFFCFIAFASFLSRQTFDQIVEKKLIFADTAQSSSFNSLVGQKFKY